MTREGSFPGFRITVMCACSRSLGEGVCEEKELKAFKK